MFVNRNITRSVQAIRRKSLTSDFNVSLYKSVSKCKHSLEIMLVFQKYLLCGYRSMLFRNDQSESIRVRFEKKIRIEIKNFSIGLDGSFEKLFSATDISKHSCTEKSRDK